MAIGESRVSYAGFATRQLRVEGAGPCIVLLHGFGHPADCWRPVLTRLADARHSAVAVDLPGFGAADRLRRGPVLPQLDEFVADLVRLYGRSDPVVLVGNSLGAIASLRAAERARGLPIRALLPLAIAGFGWTPIARLAVSFDSAPLRLAAMAPVPRAVRRELLGEIGKVLLYGRRSNVDAEMVRLLTDQALRRRDAHGLARLVRDFASAVRGSVADGIDCATIVVHGKRDRIVPLTASRRLHLAIPGSDLVVLDGVGHCPHLDAPDEIASLALDLAATPLDRSSLA